MSFNLELVYVHSVNLTSPLKIALHTEIHLQITILISTKIIKNDVRNFERVD